MDEMLDGIEGTKAIMDDILVAGKDEEEHDRILENIIRRATEYNLGLNFDKCQLRKKRVNYVGHVISGQGLEASPDKVRAIHDMPDPQSKEDVRHFLGTIQYLSKFLPDLSSIDAPL